MALRAKLLAEAVRLNPTAVIDLFRLDLRPCGAVPVTGFDGNLYFHSGNEPWRSDVVFGGRIYSQWPVETKNFEWTTTSTQPRPTISFSNVTGAFTQLNLQYGGCINAVLTRIRTFGKFLDGMPQADASCYFPPESWSINRKTQEDKEVCTYELANPMDIEDLALPRRIVLADQCRWHYRGDGCGYTGGNFADINDNDLPYKPYWNWRGGWSPAASYWYADVVATSYQVEQGAAGFASTGFYQYFVCVYPNAGQQPPDTGSSNYWQRDECSLRISGCRKRFGAAPLPFGGFPGVQLQPISTTPGG